MAANDPWGEVLKVAGSWATLGLALVVGAAVMLKAGSLLLPVRLPAGSPPRKPRRWPPPKAQSILPPRPPLGRACCCTRSRMGSRCWRRTALPARLSEAEYAAHKTAFDIVLRRAMTRSQAPPDASNQ